LKSFLNFSIISFTDLYSNISSSTAYGIFAKLIQYERACSTYNYFLFQDITSWFYRGFYNLVWLIGRGCLLLHGTWSYLLFVRGYVAIHSTCTYIFVFIIIMFNTFLSSPINTKVSISQTVRLLEQSSLSDYLPLGQRLSDVL
jgi:hypothetical protein